jgi:hypothetical protein
MIVVRWAALVHTVFALHGGDFLGAPKRRLLWAIPLVILLHPVPYLVIGSLVVIGFAAVGRAPMGWIWFLGGFYAYGLIMGLLVLTRMRKRRQRASGIRGI